MPWTHKLEDVILNEIDDLRSAGEVCLACEIWGGRASLLLVL